MSNKSTQIEQLLNKKSAAAPEVTNALKTIGDGNMLDGLKNIFSYANEERKQIDYDNGMKNGVAACSITIGILGTLYIIPKGINHFKKKYAEKKAHEEMSEKIYAAFNEEESSRSDEEDAAYVVDTECGNIEG